MKEGALVGESRITHKDEVFFEIQRHGLRYSFFLFFCGRK